MEMLEISALGIAVADACKAAKAASDGVSPLKCSEGSVGMLLEDVLEI